MGRRAKDSGPSVLGWAPPFLGCRSLRLSAMAAWSRRDDAAPARRDHAAIADSLKERHPKKGGAHPSTLGPESLARRPMVSSEREVAHGFEACFRDSGRG